MNDRWWTAALVYPAPLYAGIAVILSFGESDMAFLAGFLLVVAFGSATAFGFVRHPIWVWAGRLAIVLASVVPIGYYGWASGPFVDLTCGIVLGLPFLWLEYVWREGATPGTRVVALQATLLYGLLDLATRNVSVSTSTTTGGEQYVQGLVQVLAHQVTGIGSLLTGTAPTVPTLEATLDPVFVALGAIALMGVVLPWVSPHTALEERLPWNWMGRGSSPSPGLLDPELVGLRTGQRSALETRTLPTPPTTVLAPGLGSLLVAGLAVLAFLSLAVLAPTFALLTLVLGTVAALLTVALVLSRRLVSHGGLRA